MIKDFFRNWNAPAQILILKSNALPRAFRSGDAAALFCILWYNYMDERV